MSKKISKVIKAGVGYTIANYMVKGIVFFSIPIFSRLLSKADYGIYNNYIAYENILCILIGLALHSSLKNAKFEFKNDFNSYVSSIITLVLISGSIWFLMANVFFNLYYNVLAFDRLIINFLIAQSLCSAIFQLFNNYLALDYNYKLYMKLSFINAIGNVLISVILIMSVFKDAKYYGRIIGNAFPIILISFFIVYYFFNQERKIKKKFWKFGLKYSLPIIPHAISQIIMTSLDRIMIFYMIGQVQSGIYSFSYNIFTLVQVTTGSIDSAWGPWFYEKMNSKDYKRIRYCSDMVIIGTSFFLSAIMCFSPELILIMGSGKYADSIYTVLPIVVSGFFSFIYSFPAYIEYYYSKTKYIAYGTMLAALINIILNFLFINHYGYVAAAYTTLFTYMFYFGIHYFLSKRLFNYKLFSLRLVLLLSLVLIVINFIVLFTINSLTIRVILFVVLGLLYYFIMSRKYDVNDMVKAVVLKIRSIN